MPTFLDKIPTSIQGMKRWAVYGADKIPKVAVLGSTTLAKNDDDSHLAFFAGAHETLAYNPQMLGPTLALREDMRLVVFDIDDPEKLLTKLKDNPSFVGDLNAAVEAARGANAEILSYFAGHYIERSMSGKGFHIFVRGKLPDAKYAISVCGSIFSCGQFIHMTGDLVEGSATEILDGQATLARFHEELIKDGQYIRPMSDYKRASDDVLPCSEEFGRRLDLSDSDVGITLQRVDRLAYGLLTGQTAPADWSQAGFSILCGLDKITGDPEQVQRIYFDSVWMRNAGRSANGADRYARSVKIAAQEMQKAREKNNEQLSKDTRFNHTYQEKAVMHGALLGQAIMNKSVAPVTPLPHGQSTDRPDEAVIASSNYLEKKAPDALISSEMPQAWMKQVQQVPVQPVQQVQPVPVQQIQQLPRTSKKSGNVPRDWRNAAQYDAADHDVTLSFPIPLPPGLTGRLALEFQEMLTFPAFKNLAIMVAFATVAAMTQRSYSIGGLGTNLAILLMSPSSTGKDLASKGPATLLTQLANSYDHITPTGQNNHQRGGVANAMSLIGNRPASKQGLNNSFESNPRQLLLINEAAGWLKPNSDSGRKDQAEMGSTLLEVLTKGGIGGRLENIGHADAKNDKKGCLSPCLTLLMESQVTTMLQALQLNDVDSGIVNRLELIDCSTKSGKRGKANPAPRRECSPELLGEFLPLINHVMNIPHLANVHPTLLEVAMSPEATSILNSYDATTTNNLSEKERPNEYYLFARASARILQYAANLAIADNCYAPCVTAEHMNWAADFIHEERLNTLKRFEEGEVGTGDAPRTKKLEELLQQYVNGKHHDHDLATKSVLHIRRSFLNKFLASYACFQRDGNKDKNELINSLIITATNTGLLVPVIKGTPYFTEIFGDKAGLGYAIDLSAIGLGEDE